MLQGGLLFGFEGLVPRLWHGWKVLELVEGAIERNEVRLWGSAPEKSSLALHFLF